MLNPSDVRARDIVVVKKNKDTYYYYLVDFANPDSTYFSGYRIHLGGDWYKCKEFYVDKEIMQGKFLRNTGGWVNLFTGRASLSKDIIVEKTGTMDEARYAELLYYYVMIATGNYSLIEGVFRVAERPLLLHVPFSTMIESAMNLTKEGLGVTVTPEVMAAPTPESIGIPPTYFFRGIQVTDTKKNYASLTPMPEGKVVEEKGSDPPTPPPAPTPDPASPNPENEGSKPPFATVDADQLKSQWKACKTDEERINLVFEKCVDEEGRLPVAETYGTLFTRYDGKGMKKPLPNSVMLPRKHFDIIYKSTSQRTVIVYDYPRMSGESKRLSPSGMKTTIERVKSIAMGKDMVV